MKNSDLVFKLIHSLSGVEKSYIKKFMSFHSNDQKNYLVLFDAINNQKSYNEKQLRKDLQGYSFISRLSSEKVYLYNQVLKGLRAYHSDSSVEQKIKNGLSNISILYKKELYFECQKQIEKVKTLAIKYDLPLYLSRVLQYQFDVALIQGFSDNNLIKINEIAEQIQEAAYLYKTIMDIKVESVRIHFKMFNALNTESDLGSRQIKIQFPVISKVLNDGSEVNLSYNAKRAYYFSNMYLSISTNSMESFKVWNDKFILLLEENPHQVAENPKHYLSALAHQLSIVSFYRKYDQIPSLISKLAQLSKGVKKIGTEYFIIEMEFQLIYNLNTGKYKELRQNLNAFAMFIENGKKGNSFSVGYYYFLAACCYYSIGDQKKSKKYLTSLLNMHDRALPEELYFVSNILKMIIFIDSKDVFGFEMQVKELEKVISALNSKKTYLIEVFKILATIGKNKLLVTNDSQSLMDFRNLISEIFQQNAFILDSWNYFSPVKWIEAEMSGLKYSDVLSRR